MNNESFGAVACPKFLATENMPRIRVKLHIVYYSIDNESLPSLDGSRRNLHASSALGQRKKNPILKSFPSHL